MKSWPFWVDLLIWCLLIMLVWTVVTAMAVATVGEDAPPPFPGKAVQIARSPKDAAAQSKAVIAPAPVTCQVSAYFPPTTYPNLTAFFQVTTNLTDWSTIYSAPYPGSGATLQANYTNFGGQAFFRAGYSFP